MSLLLSLRRSIASFVLPCLVSITHKRACCLQMSFEDGALVEPLAVGVHSVSTLANVRAGDIVAVFGAGPVGLLAMAVAKGW